MAIGPASASAPIAVPPLSWEDLEALAPPEPDRIEGPTNSQARLRLFGQSASAVRVTLYRDHHAWCPYCQKVWLWLEEKRVPYRVRKVTMRCYGPKEPWYEQLVPSGMLPALELDGRLITESDAILLALERSFGPLGAGLEDPAVLPLRQLERALFRAWCGWLCSPPGADQDREERAARAFEAAAARLAADLVASEGPFLLPPSAGGPDGSSDGFSDGFSSADLVFVPFLERMQASLFYYKGLDLRRHQPAIGRWFEALERRPTYRGTRGDIHTHAHDLPPQLGSCSANGTAAQRSCAAWVDAGPWCDADGLPLRHPDPDTCLPVPEQAAAEALGRVLRHRQRLQALNPDQPERFDAALRAALTRLIRVKPCHPPAGSAAGLRHLRDRISVPRDMGLHAARLLRQALEDTAALDGDGQGEPLPIRHRLDQTPAPFLSSEDRI